MTNSDDFIQADVLYLLRNNLSLPLDGLSVVVEGGWVTLSGCVDWEFQKTAAEWGILEHSGAAGIINRIAVKPECEVDVHWGSRWQRRAAGK